jgi:hypothetical protein
MNRTHTPIAVFVGGEAFASTLQALIDADDGIRGEQEWIEGAIAHGETFHGGGGAAAEFYIVPLHHRDAPSHAAEKLTLDQMSDLLRLFCESRGLPFRSADELLAEVLESAGSPELINWLSDYSEAYMDHREYCREPETQEQAKEYGFDVTLSAVIRVKASSEEDARRTLHARAGEMDCNGGAWPSGDPILFSAYIVGRSDLIEIDGDEAV